MNSEFPKIITEQKKRESSVRSKPLPILEYHKHSFHTMKRESENADLTSL